MKREEHAGIAIREVRPGYWVADFQRGGKRVRKAFKDLSDAKVWAEAKKTEIVNKGVEALNVSDKVRADALESMRLLEGTGVSIVDAVRDYLRRHPSTAGQTVSQTCDMYLVAMRNAGLRPLSIYDKEIKFNVLCDAMGTTPVAAVDEADVEQWALARGGSPVTIKAYTTVANSVLLFYRRGNRLKARGVGDEKAPETWDIQTVQKVLATAEKIAPDTVPALAVLFFAGLRPHEMLRLTWAQIDMQAGVIRLTGADTKTRTMRNVEIADNLRAWLTVYRSSGPVAPSPSRYRDQREAVMKASGVSAWPVDIARHTFATMHYNAHQNAAATMAQLGHFGNAQMFVKHYKGVPVTADEAAAYWKIKPNKSAQTTLQFKAAG
jgi:integrase